MTKQRIAVLMGGPSSEHDISLVSGAQVAEALASRWDVVQVRIDRDRGWCFGETKMSVGAALDRLGDVADVVFPALHGQFGEDGTVQALLEAKGLPYVGSRVAASALAMDKARTKHIYLSAGLPTPAFAALSPGDESRIADEVRLTFPCVVKPASAGSSVGVSFPSDPAEAEGCVRAHLAAGVSVVVESAVRGREFTCGVLETDTGPTALPVTEIIPEAGHAFFDYEAKYTPGASREVVPAEVSSALAEQIAQLALSAHRALGCRDLSRSDVMLDGGKPLLLETNTLPGFTPISLFPQAAVAAGWTFVGLVDHLAHRALARGP